MKQTILQISIFFFTMALTITSQGQVTITEAAFPRLAEFTDTIYKSTTSPAVPTIGTAQVWDYSDMVLEEIIEKEYYDATNDTEFPGALNGTIADLIFQGFIIESDAYEGIDSEGWYALGRYNFGVGYSITAISGGPGDSLWFPETAEIFDGRINNIKFPLQYQDQWTESRVEDIPFALSIAAFGLDQVPGKRQRTVTHDREVVAYGELIMPKADGTPTLPLDVLLIKAVETQVDSVFLGGAPAPVALLTAFGLVQGATITETVYIFYTPNIGTPVMDIAEDGNHAFYRPQVADNLTATRDLNLAPISYFPNPATAGQTINISTQDPIGSGAVRFTDLAGRQIFQTTFEAGFGNEVQIDLPATIGTGLYMYHVLDRDGTPVGLGKLQVN